MLTPTGVTSAAYWEAIKSGMPTHIRITFLGQDVVLTDADIEISGGLRVTDILNGDTDLVFGKAICKQVSVTFLNSKRLEGLLWTSEFKLEMGVEIGDPAETNWVTIGYFSGEKPQNVTTVRKIEFTAYDRMTLFDGLADDYVKSIEYPATLQDIYDGLCASVGIENEAGNELPDIMTRIFDVAPAEMEGYTCRDLLAWIAEACGCYAKINSAGKAQLVWFTDNTSHEVSEDEEFNVETGDVNAGMIWNTADTFTWDEIGVMTWNDVTGYEEAFAIDEVMVKQLGSNFDINYPCPFGGNVYMIVENPFLSIRTETELNNFIVPIYNRLSVLGGYLPVNLHCVGDWCVEAGDVITIVVNGMEISFPIFMKTMTWNGAINDEYETTGNINREIYTSETNKRKVMENNKIELYVTALEDEVEQNYYRIRSGITISASGITIDGSRFIKMNSGSEIDIESGGKINVKSGGDININSGGDVNVKSGGKVTVESGADLDINSGGDVNVKSGGNLNVASGGNIDIHGTGTLSLTGSTVEIKSGSTFDLLSDNFVINSDSKVIIIRPDSVNSWRIDENGLCLYNSTLHNKIVGISGNFMSGSSTQMAPHVGFFAYYPDGDTTHGRAAWSASDFTAHRLAYLYLEYDQTNGAKLLPQSSMANVFSIGSTANCFEEVHARHLYGDLEHKIILIHPSSDIDRVVRILDNTDGTYNVQGYTITGRGTGTQTWTSKEIKFYGSIVAVSSRSRKHDIKRLDDAGDIIDKLKPVSFAYNNDPKNRKRLGLIYEDTINVLPEICDPGDENTEKSINYVELVPVLLKEIQSLRKRVKELEERR